MLDSAATLLHTTITGCRAEDANATAQGGGIAAFRSTVLLANGSLIIGSYASGSGRALAITGSQVVFKLPAPPGRWIAGTLCAVYRAACPTIEDSAGGTSTQDPDCLRTASQCSQENRMSLRSSMAWRASPQRLPRSEPSPATASSASPTPHIPTHCQSCVSAAMRLDSIPRAHRQHCSGLAPSSTGRGLPI